MSSSGLNTHLSQATGFFGLRLWVVIGIGVGVFIVFILFLLSVWLASSWKRPRNAYEKFPMAMSSSAAAPSMSSSSGIFRIPSVSKEIKEVVVPSPATKGDAVLLTITDKSSENSKEKVYVHVGFNRRNSGAPSSAGGSAAVVGVEMGRRRGSSTTASTHGEIEEPSPLPLPSISASPSPSLHQRGSSLEIVRAGGVYPDEAGSATTGWSGEHSGSSVVGDGNGKQQQQHQPDMVSHLGWGHWYTLRDLEAATTGFSPDNVLGEGGYGIVYRGSLSDGTLVAVKSLLNNRGQAEKEFRVEVEAIGRVRHKNLVRLLGYCVEGNYRMLVYEFVDNGNLEQWLHGPASILNSPTWEVRMKIAQGAARALAYLHEALEPKVVHRDIKASNILLDGHWNAKISDFGLAKMLGSDNSHVKTRVMGTFGYVAPEYANTGLLNERSDVYSFGVLLMEIITGRDPVDYGRPSGEVNLVDWVKQMVASRRSEEVADERLDCRPSGRALKRALLVALRCVDPDALQRPKMGHVVHMLETDELASREESRSARDLLSRRTTNADHSSTHSSGRIHLQSKISEDMRSESSYNS